MKRSHRIILLMAFIIILLTVTLGRGETVLAVGEFTVGDGSSENPYQITTAEQLNNVRNNLSACYKLMNNIDLTNYLSSTGAGYNSGAGWVPIGTSTNPFAGNFDGSGFTICNLSINAPSQGLIGLFGVLGINGKIERLRLQNVNLTGLNSIGGLVGYNSGNIHKCSVTGTVKGMAAYYSAAGGLVGVNCGGMVSESYSEAIMDGGPTDPNNAHRRFGGLVGENSCTVDKEAAFALGFSRWTSFFKVTLPQALRHILPIYKGEFISMVKTTSVVGYIAIQDLTKMSDIIRSRTFDAFFPLFVTAFIYFIVTYLFILVLNRIEVRIDPKRRKRVVKGITPFATPSVGQVRRAGV